MSTAFLLHSTGLPVGHYKGFAGSIRCIECHSKQAVVASCGLDRFVRVHNINTRKLVQKVSGVWMKLLSKMHSTMEHAFVHTVYTYIDYAVYAIACILYNIGKEDRLTLHGPGKCCQVIEIRHFHSRSTWSQGWIAVCFQARKSVWNRSVYRTGTMDPNSRRSAGTVLILGWSWIKLNYLRLQLGWVGVSHNQSSNVKTSF